MVEHRPVKAIVAGSSPASGAMKNPVSSEAGFFISEPNPNRIGAQHPVRSSSFTRRNLFRA
jgi:hypothetical protein